MNADGVPRAAAIGGAAPSALAQTVAGGAESDPPPDTSGGGGYGAFFAALGVAIVLTIVGGYVIMHFKRQSERRLSDLSARGIMDEFRRLRDEGVMSEAEFDAAKRALVNRAAGRAAETRDEPATRLSTARPPAPRAGTAEPLAAGRVAAGSGDQTGPTTRAAPPGEARAEPGFDLLGRPLPSGDRHTEQS